MEDLKSNCATLALQKLKRAAKSSMLIANGEEVIAGGQVFHFDFNFVLINKLRLKFYFVADHIQHRQAGFLDPVER
jgi:hypothetical protein